MTQTIHPRHPMPSPNLRQQPEGAILATQDPHCSQFPAYGRMIFRLSGLDLALIRHGGARHPRCGAPDTAIQPDHSLPPPSPTPRAAATAAVAGGRILKLAPMRLVQAVTGRGGHAE